MSRRNNLAMVEQTPFLEMLAGGQPGQIFELVNNSLSVGRSDDNDIVAPSEAVSRYHAIFQRDEEGNWCVRDNQSKNGVQVNGTSVELAKLTPGDLIQVGNYAFRYGEGEAIATEEPDENNYIASAVAANAHESHEIPGYGASAKPKKKPNRRLLIYSVVFLVLGLVYMQSQEDGTKPEEKKDETSTKLARDFKGAEAPKMVPGADDKAKTPLIGIEDPTLKQAELDMAKLDWSNSSLREAEQYFRKGQREYLTKNFGRSIELFSTALSLYRGHELADKYLRLAIFNAEQEAKRNMEIAVRYFESLQYQRAMYHFSEVITLMGHRPTEVIVTESEKYIQICKKRLQAAELFP